MRRSVISILAPRITLLGGQAFNWGLKGSWYTGFTQNEVIRLRYSTRTRQLFYMIFCPNLPANDSSSKEPFSPATYFRTDVSYTKVLKSFNRDQNTAVAIKKYFGLRVLRQDFEQTLLSYILSSQNNIKRIRLIVRHISESLGTPVLSGTKTVHLFPSTASIANSSISILKNAGCGFRAKYIRTSARMLLDTELTRKISKYHEEKAREALLEFPGVGEKIADCSMLYGLGFDNVMPMDVWCKRVLTDLYGLNAKMKYKDMRLWAEEYFGPYAGWAGQFLFEYLRNHR